MPPPSSKLNPTPLLIAVTFPQPPHRWAARGTFGLAPSSRTRLGQMPCLFRPSRHRPPYSERWPLLGRFFFKQVQWLVISPAVPRLKFLTFVLSSRPSGVLFFQNTWTCVDQFVPLILSTLALTHWDFFPITLFPRCLVLGLSTPCGHHVHPWASVASD